VIVDDHARFRDAARQLLEARGYEVIAEAGCAMTAWDAVERHAPEAVLLDVRLGADTASASAAR
jgi:DNA-binding NarL/FixJ family response regulator